MCAAAGTEADGEGAEGAEGAKRTHRGGGGEKWAPAPQYGTAAYDDREAKFEMLQVRVNTPCDHSPLNFDPRAKKAVELMGEKLTTERKRLAEKCGLYGVVELGFSFCARRRRRCWAIRARCLPCRCVYHDDTCRETS